MRKYKEILIEKDEVVTTKFMFRAISLDFMKYEFYKKTRSKLDMDFQSKCFLCDSEFKEDENMALLSNGPNENRLCCENCAEKIMNETI